MTDSPQQRSWFARNRTWVLGLAIGVPLLCCGGFGVIGYLAKQAATKAVQSSEVWVDVMSRLAVDQRVNDALGFDAAPGMPTSSTVKLSNGTGTAEIVVPVTGEKGSGTLYVNATKSGGPWDYQRLELKLADGTSIDLLSPPPDTSADVKAPALPPPDDSDVPEPADPPPAPGE